MNISTVIAIIASIIIDIIRRCIKPYYIILVPLVETKSLSFLPTPALRKFRGVSQKEDALNSISLPFRLELVSNRYIAMIMRFLKVKGLLLRVKSSVHVNYSSSKYQSYGGIILGPNDIENPSFEEFTLHFSWIGVKDKFYISFAYSVMYEGKKNLIKDLILKILLIGIKTRIIKEENLIIELK